MLKIIAIAGEPGVGKSTLMKKVMDQLGKSNLQKIKTVYYHRIEETKAIVLGRYDTDEFPGTDRLSMSVQPIAMKVMEKWSKDNEMRNWTVLFEGDRLCGISFLRYLKDLSNAITKIFLITASPENKELRHQERGDTQPEKWLKDRMTKIANIRSHFESSIITLPNDTKAQLTLNRDRILEDVVGY